VSERYFSTPRREILSHLPANVNQILDVGCGTGATTALLRTSHQIDWAGGVELRGHVATEAEKVFDKVWVGSIEQIKLEDHIAPQSLNLILCLDVLEHLSDPWQVVRRISSFLKPRGRLIISVPNIRNWKFITGLMLRGDFSYRDSGLLDRTHLRFFVRETAIELATAGGLRLVSCLDAKEYKALEFRNLLLACSFGKASEFIAKQWLVVAEGPNI
jgi:2-polyprenyl-3-methyl-5-hydroxy-6-metoxy-1,4-benzoquinol methylase